jgi:hypothetical protein
MAQNNLVRYGENLGPENIAMALVHVIKFAAFPVMIQWSGPSLIVSRFAA